MPEKQLKEYVKLDLSSVHQISPDGIFLCMKEMQTEAFTKSNHQVFFKKDLPENFANFRGKHLCRSISCNKVVIWIPDTCFFISNQVAKGLMLKIVQKFSNLLSNLQR